MSKNAVFNFPRISPQAFSLIAAAFLGFIAAKFITGMRPLFVVAAVVGGLLLMASFLKPEIGILAVIIITSSIIFEKALPLVPIAIGSFHAADVILLLLLCMIPYKILTDKNFRLVRTPLDAPLILFYIAALISAYIALARFHTSFNTVMRALRPITYYLIFFPIANLIRNKKQLISVIRGVSFIAIVVGMAMVIQAMIGESIQIMPGRVETLETLGEKYYGTTRVIPPGDALIYVMFITFVCFTIPRKASVYNLSHFFKIGLLGMGLLLTFDRNYWLTAFFSLSLFTLLVSEKQKIRIIALVFAILIIIGALSPIFVIAGGRLGGFVSSTIDRTTSLFAGDQMFRSATLDARRIENEYAISQIMQYPILGIGTGNSYIPGERWPGDKGTYIHNSYLWILMKMGIIGFIPFIWLSITFMIRGLLKWRTIDDGLLKAVAIGFTLSYLGLMVSNMIAPKFMEWQAITVIGAMMGINEAIYRINNKKIEQNAQNNID